MKKTLCLLGWVIVVVTLAASRAGAGEPSFSRLKPLPAPRIVAAAEEYPGGSYAAARLLDGNPDTAYASSGKGTETFVEFDFGAPVRIAAMKYVDRNDAATVAESKLTFLDPAGKAVAAASVRHVNQRAGVTFFPLPEPVAAQRVRWQVTKLGSPHGTVGGSEMVFFTSQEPEAAPRGIGIEALAIPVVERRPTGQVQPLRVTLDYPYATAAAATVRVAGQEPRPLQLTFGSHTLPYTIPVVASDKPLEVAVDYAGRTVASRAVTLKPPRKTTIYILPHSHTDIGYTEIQTEIEDKQVNNLLRGIEYAKMTAGYPPGARFVWNVEVLWAADLYLRRLGEPQRAAFLEAVKKGQVALCGMYLNELTGLCRPEELMRLFRFATQLRRKTGATLDSAMISDVPGYTWGTVPAMARNGIRYFSVGPNHIHRIGRTLSEWGDRPFYWVSPSGQEKVLCWIAGHGYSWFHNGLLGKLGTADHGKLLDYLNQLESAEYPYELVQLRYTTDGDNGPPDPALPELVIQWNARYEWPKMRIATTAELFRQFEKRYGKSIPEVRGDFTPYWEDGAGSSARETALARNAAERLVQAEALWAMLRPDQYPDREFYDAWRDVILYNEHTWGAHCSISQPDSQFTKDQWAIKQAFAVDAARRSRRLSEGALAGRRAGASPVEAVEVLNTTSWPRTDLVLLPPDAAVVGDGVRTADEEPVPSQRLHNGALAFLAENVPPLGARRFLLAAGRPGPAGSAKAEDGALANSELRLLVDKTSGAITSLTANGIPNELIDPKAGSGLNEYYYVAGRKPDNPRRNGPVTIKVQDAGPLVASLAIESEAPGCRRLLRELRVVDRLGRVDVINTVDKSDIRQQESVHFGFSLHIPQGTMRLDTPWAVVRPEVDQLCGACKNYFTVGRWVDISNAEYGVTWATLDAQLIEVGRISVDVPSPLDPEAWIEHLEPRRPGTPT